MGVPVIGCGCAVCSSGDPRNRRLRTSALLEIGDATLLIDAGPDLRQQALRAGLRRIDAILLTHAHADHVAGIDDLRPINFAQRAPIPVYGSAPTLAAVRERFAYAFSAEASAGSTRPALELHEVAAYAPFSIGGIDVLPFDVHHGSWTISGFRIGALGYVTDASALPDASKELLQGLDLLVLNALRHRPHPTHLTLAAAAALVDELGPRRALFVHMDHELDHELSNAMLPPHVRLAYDGQVIEIMDQVCELQSTPG
jgi:phosphoribosyl 1,2-cyclic phosphate phosphodiesterase